MKYDILVADDGEDGTPAELAGLNIHMMPIVESWISVETEAEFDGEFIFQSLDHEVLVTRSIVVWVIVKDGIIA